jgi:hypothetical protein
LDDELRAALDNCELPAEQVNLLNERKHAKKDREITSSHRPACCFSDAASLLVVIKTSLWVTHAAAENRVVAEELELSPTQMSLRAAQSH